MGKDKKKKRAGDAALSETAPAESKSTKKKKLSKHEQKELQKRQAENEKRLIKEGVISERVRYAPRSFFWNAIAICLAFFLGIAFAVGAAIIAGSKSSVKKLMDRVGLDSAKLISEEYADQSIINLFYEIKSTQFTNLNSLGKFTPLLGNSINKLGEQFAALGVHLNVSELMDVSFGELGSYFQTNVVQTIVLGDTLGLTPSSSPLMIALCYGEEGEDYEVNEGAFVMKEGKSPTTIADLTSDADGMLGRVTVESALNVTAASAPAMRYLAYGSEGETYDIVDGQIVMRTNAVTGEPFRKKSLNSLTAAGTDFIGDARVKDLIDLTNANEFMNAIKEWNISDLKNSNRINRLKISQIINTENSSSLLMQAIKDWRIKDLTNQSNINSLSLGDVIEIKDEGAEGGASPKILRTLKHSTLGNFGNAIDHVRLCDILDDDLSKNDFLRNLQSSTLKTLASDIQNLTVADVFGNKIYAYASLDQIKSFAPAGETFNSYEDYINYYATVGRTDADFSELKPTALKNVTVNTSTVLKTDRTVSLSEGWFSGQDGSFELQEITDDDVHTDIRRENESTVKYYYYEKQIPVTPAYVWKLVDYNANSSQWMELPVSENKGGLICQIHESNYPVFEDAYSYYVIMFNADGELERFDLDRQISGYERDGVLIAGNPTGYRKAEGETEGYYYVAERVDVEKRYYPADGFAGVSYEKAETALAFFYNAAAEGEEPDEVELDRYLNGIWYLLLNKEGGDGEYTRVTDLSDEVNRVSALLDKTALWQLYVHDLITINPYNDMGSVNLNEKTIYDVIHYMKNGNF